MNDVQSECSGYDLALGSIRGVRAFRVDRLGRLKALQYNHIWTPGENVAFCRRDEGGAWGHITFTVTSSWLGAEPEKKAKPQPHTGVDPLCTCGFYAYHDGVSDFGQASENLTGIVEGYGKTTIGTRGFRAQKGRIVALVAPPRPRVGWRRWHPVIRRHKVDRDLMARVRRNYPDVPVFPSLKAALRQFPMPAQADHTPETDEQFWTRAS